MNITINQQILTFDKEIKLTEVLEIYKASQPYAILLNGEFLPQSEHGCTWLKDSDKIDVVGAIQGG
ncbi:hypothetical protein THMIRHAM_10930 [Thiomicrorhabdus immobilis]|uniref:Thiamine biosynthesis protein ThiS n=1 Tax=Thiomicrorhabdus immobilis TaxID=2791037 RepID=A0ABN6CW64_9GAMM|nr:sulfur carrier protein ThiS [Thiomicrorhabdus immobilis]BCN93308.1 hypothetical protein THMIRHAM_10930 [Thiomicrorhabdus immobilis]